MPVSTYLSIITLNVSGLNAPIKIHSGWMDKKQDPSLCCLQETHFRAKDTHRLKVRGWIKLPNANKNGKKAGQQYLYQTK